MLRCTHFQNTPLRVQKQNTAQKKSFYKKSFLFIWHLISHWWSGVRVGAALATAQWELRGSCVSWKWHRAICYKTPFSDVKSTWHVYTEMRDYAKVFFRSKGQWSRSKTFSIREWDFYFLLDIYPSLDHSGWKLKLRQSYSISQKPFHHHPSMYTSHWWASHLSE